MPTSCQKRGPRLERLGELLGGERVVIRAHAGAVVRTLQRVDHVPPEEPPAIEAPFAVDANVRVPVLEHAVVPAAVRAAELVVAVDDAARVVGVVEVDDVVADEVHRHLRFAQRRHEPGAQCGAPALLTSDPDVGREERHQHVHVTRIERERVTHGQLPDLRQ